LSSHSNGKISVLAGAKEIKASKRGTAKREGNNGLSKLRNRGKHLIGRGDISIFDTSVPPWTRHLRNAYEKPDNLSVHLRYNKPVLGLQLGAILKELGVDASNSISISLLKSPKEHA